MEFEIGTTFQVGDCVKKVTGEYKAEGGGSFLHIYGPNNLKLADIIPKTFKTELEMWSHE